MKPVIGKVYFERFPTTGTAVIGRKIRIESVTAKSLMVRPVGHNGDLGAVRRIGWGSWGNCMTVAAAERLFAAEAQATRDFLRIRAMRLPDYEAEVLRAAATILEGPIGSAS